MPGKHISAKPDKERESFIVGSNETLRYSTALQKPKTKANCQNTNRIQNIQCAAKVGSLKKIAAGSRALILDCSNGNQ
jgi:hypothetical protein